MIQLLFNRRISASNIHKEDFVFVLTILLNIASSLPLKVDILHHLLPIPNAIFSNLESLLIVPINDSLSSCLFVTITDECPDLA